MIVYELNNLRTVNVISRPSKICKSPYVADIIIEDQIIQAHAPSLGCCGLCEKDARVLVTPKKDTTKICKYTIQLSIFTENKKQNTQLIGINPKLAETIVENVLKLNLFTKLKVKSFKREVKILNSRFDFVGLDEEDNSFVLEVKNVPLADYIDCDRKERMKYNFDDKEANEKISYFPDGYRKKKTDVISPRALKHIQELHTITKTSKTKTYICYVIQRDDIKCFQPSNIDIIYKNAVKEAHQDGVQIIPLVVKWNIEGQCHFVTDELPVII
uniref:Sugar fermentation stimulation protein C-terminal domain-containing protein n=1 Tax=viral metagenome TaxID=1070528 RepID=A0A6C0KEG4_9ZZZZ